MELEGRICSCSETGTWFGLRACAAFVLKCFANPSPVAHLILCYKISPFPARFPKPEGQRLLLACSPLWPLHVEQSLIHTRHLKSICGIELSQQTGNFMWLRRFSPLTHTSLLWYHLFKAVYPELPSAWVRKVLIPQGSKEVFLFNFE